MKTDLQFCMSSYLQYRTIVDKNCRFSDHTNPWYYDSVLPRIPVASAAELDQQLRLRMESVLAHGPVALMLSSGMDSAILASYLPEGTQTYTLRCNADSGIDETPLAAYYAKKNKLKHTIIDICWEDYETYTLPLMRQKGYPIHSIEVQIYKAALQAKKDGIQTLIFGETADIIYGGHSKLLERDWDLESFTSRFSFVDPKMVMRSPLCIQEPILPYCDEQGMVDVFAFLNGFEYDVSLGFYNNACKMAGMAFYAPYAFTILNGMLDVQRVRQGESKYIIRELFKKVYPECPMPDKTPLPRPMAEWMSVWEGPQHPLLYKDNIASLSGDQKWYVYALDQFLCHIVEE